MVFFFLLLQAPQPTQHIYPSYFWVPIHQLRNTALDHLIHVNDLEFNCVCGYSWPLMWSMAKSQAGGFGRFFIHTCFLNTSFPCKSWFMFVLGDACGISRGLRECLLWKRHSLVSSVRHLCCVRCCWSLFLNQKWPKLVPIMSSTVGLEVVMGEGAFFHVSWGVWPHNGFQLSADSARGWKWKWKKKNNGFIAKAAQLW